MSGNDLFPDIVSVVRKTPPKPCTHPYFIVAYWPKGEWWKIHSKDMFKSPDDAVGLIKDLERCGWIYITIMKLPDTLWL